MQVKYKQYINRCKSKEAPAGGDPLPQTNDTLLDFAGANSLKSHDVPKTNTAKKNAMDELGDIFSTETGNSLDSDVAVSAEPLKPVNLMSKGW